MKSFEESFATGTVFGFDVGTASIAHTVRKGPAFDESGVLACASDIGDLKNRRTNRSGRRVLDHRQAKRDWFGERLAEVLGIELHEGQRLPVDAWESLPGKVWKPTAREYADPVALRMRALAGEDVGRLGLFTALAHVVKRRGYAERVPWRQSASEQAKDDDAKTDTIPPAQVRKEFEKKRSEAPVPAKYHPCHFLADLVKDKNKRQRKRAWPRDLMEAEALAIIEAQKAFHPALQAERKVTDVTGETRTMTTTDWLLHGNASIITKRDVVTGEDVEYRVFHRNHRDRERAPFTFQAARIHNRSPGLDLIRPYDDEGRPMHVMSRSHPAYRAWQIEVALLNFRVEEIASRKPGGYGKPDKPGNLIRPPADAMEVLRALIERKMKEAEDSNQASAEDDSDDDSTDGDEEVAASKSANKGVPKFEVTVEDLEAWVKPYTEAGRFALGKEPKPLVGKGAGRGAFNKHGLAQVNRVVQELMEKAKKEVDQYLKPRSKKAQNRYKSQEEKLTHKMQVVQQEHVNYARQLRRPWRNPELKKMELEPWDKALHAYIEGIRDPMVRHRIRLFERLLASLAKTHGVPDHVVVECVRELEPSAEDAKEGLKNRQQREKANATARQALKEMGFEPNDKNIRKFRLLQEARWKCPYTGERFMQEKFDELIVAMLVPAQDHADRSGFLAEAKAAMGKTEVEHMVPQSVRLCDEWFNITVTTPAVNARKGKLTPYEFLLAECPDKEERKKRFEEVCGYFGKDSFKAKIFSSPEAASLIESLSDLQRTAYFARCIRHVCLLKFGWLTDEGRDPVGERDHDVNRRYLVTNGGITARLRKAWKLDALLHADRISDAEWEALRPEEKEERRRQRRVKNRQDLRHHALDSMIIACTLPWAANSTVWQGGWCNLDQEDGSVSSVRCGVWGEDDYGQQIRDHAKAALDNMLTVGPTKEEPRNGIRHHRPRGSHAQVFDRQLHGVRESFQGRPLGKKVYVTTKALRDLKPESLKAPPPDPETEDGSEYLPSLAEWRAWVSESLDDLQSADESDPAKDAKRLKKVEEHREWLAMACPAAKAWEKFKTHRYPKSTGDTIFSPLLREHIKREWEAYTADPANWQAILSETIEVLERELAEAQGAKRPNKRTISACHGRLALVAKWQLVSPNDENWKALQEWLFKRRGGGQQAKAVFPDAFLRTLRHPVYKDSPIERIKVIAQSGKEKDFVEMSPGGFIKYASEYGTMNVYQSRDPKGKVRYVAWLKRRFYPEGKNKDRPTECHGLHPVVSFTHKQAVLIKNDMHAMKAGTRWLICERGPKDGGNATITLVPAHLALTVADPDNPRKPIPLKTKGNTQHCARVGLADFMHALGYESSHPPSVEP